MNGRSPGVECHRAEGRSAPPVTDNVFDLAGRRIAAALAHRSRYRYVRPRVERAGGGWQVLSPNCSRSVDSQGGEIAIAWLLPANEGRWLLHARDHAQQCWRLEAAEPTLHAALERLCRDPQRVFWP